MPPHKALFALSRSGWSSQFVAQCRARTWQESARSLSGVAASRPKVKSNPSNRISHRGQPHSIRNASWFSRSQPEPRPQTAAPDVFVPDDASPSSALHPPAEPILPDVSDVAGGVSEKTPFANDHIGFLEQDYGIDFGWGTSSIVKYLFEHVHVYSGLPFAGSIIITGALIRLFMIFPTISSVENTTKMAAMMPVTKPLMERAKQATAVGDNAEMQRVRIEIRDVYRDQGIKYWKFGLGFLHIPLGFGCWRTFRNMADLPVTGMTTGGYAWFTNLCVPDPTYALPLATAALQHFSAKWASENQAVTLSGQQAKLQKVMIYGLPVLTVVFIGFAPAAVQIHFATTATFALITNVALRSPTVRSWMRMTAQPRKTDPQSPYKGTINVNGRSSPTAPGGTRTGPTPASPSPAPSKQGILRRMTGGAAGLFTGAKKSVNSVMPDAHERVKKYQDRNRKTKANEYEMRRRREIDEERVDWERSRDFKTFERTRKRS